MRWRGRFGVVVAGSLAAGALYCPAGALGGGTTNIAVNDDFFSPDDVEDLGFQWDWDPGGDGVTANEHNVRQDDKFFYSGPLSNSDSYGVTLEGAGRYHYYCEEHGTPSGGMDGIARKYIFPGPVVAEDSQVINWSGDALDRYRYDVQYRKNGGKWRDWKVDTAKTNQAFGANDKPVDVNPGALYEIRARTQKKNNLSKRTGWSNKFTVDVSP